jgi:DNA-directed RNA polymerase specialized sigma subunit
VREDEARAQVQAAWDSLIAYLGRQPTLAELATETGVSEAELSELLGTLPEEEGPGG